MTWHWGAFILGFLIWPAIGMVLIAVGAWCVKSKPMPRFRTLEEVVDRALTVSELEARGVNVEHLFYPPNEQQAAIERLLKEVGGR